MTVGNFIKIKLYFIALFIFVIYLVLDTDMQDIKDGDSTLICNIKGKGWIHIDQQKIKAYISDIGVWVFTNGSAKNCIVKNEQAI